MSHNIPLNVNMKNHESLWEIYFVELLFLLECKREKVLYVA